MRPCRRPQALLRCHATLANFYFEKCNIFLKYRITNSGLKSIYTYVSKTTLSYKKMLVFSLYFLFICVPFILSTKSCGGKKSGGHLFSKVQRII